MAPWSARGGSKGSVRSGRSGGAKSPVFDKIVVDGLGVTGKTHSNKSQHTDDTEGDGGCVKSRFAEAALDRRGGAARRDLEDQSRIYSNIDQKQWEQKYKFFSARHMERSYRLFTRARHDPFNKDPSWGKGIIHRVAEACLARGVSPESLFSGIDINHDGSLSRPELKRVIVSVLPALSDEELTAIFDTIDEDHSGEVNVQEFCDIIRKGKNLKVSDAIVKRWRNPVHRIKRLAPSQIEGWDHLEGDLKFTQCGQLCNSMQQAMSDRLDDSLVQSARSRPKSLVAARHKYDCFAGGSDTDRFRREQWAKDRAEGNVMRTTPRILDPGPYPKPGWMYHAVLSERTDSQGTKFELPRSRTPLSAR